MECELVEKGMAGNPKFAGLAIGDLFVCHESLWIKSNHCLAREVGGHGSLSEFDPECHVRRVARIRVEWWEA